MHKRRQNPIRRPAIRYISRKWPPAVGGMETYSIKLVERLNAFADVRTFVLPGRLDGNVPSAIQLMLFGMRAVWHVVTVRHAADVTHISDMASWPLAFAARLRAPRSTIAISAHGTDVSYPLRGGVKAALYSWYLKLGARLLGNPVVIANSRTTADATEKFGFRNVQVIPLATDMRPSMANNGTHDATILFVGRLIPLKGCAWFIREVLPKLPLDVTLRVVGTVWDREEAASLNDARVEFLGKLHGPDLARAYQRAMCVIVPNIKVATGQFEGYGLTATEAAAAGGVVLAADRDGLREAVMSGQTGFHLPSGDASAWADKILEVQNWDPERRRKFLSHAMETSFRIYTWERVAQDTFAAYGTVTPGARAP